MNKFLKVIAIVLCAATLVVASVAATVAYLTMKTSTVENTFTSGNIEITLVQESQLNVPKMVPGQKFTVNPRVTVTGESESCYLFIKIKKSDNFDDFFSYEVVTGETGWTPLDDVSGVYYREVNYNVADQVFDVIADDQITARVDCTKQQYTELGGTPFNLSFTAYAVQKVGFANAEAAWVEAQNLDNSNT